MTEENRTYITHLKVADVPWHRLTTAYGRGTEFPAHLTVLEQMRDLASVKESLYELTTNMEHQSTLWHATPFGMVFLNRILEKALAESGQNPVAHFLAGELLDFFACILQCFHDGDEMEHAEALPLYGLRQNIFTDPQKPMKVAPGIYPINGATPDDPCALTVDFALTYFLVSGELERSKVPINLLITDASGMSVLTAWAAGKFSSTSVKKFFDEFDLANKINNRTLIIPGKVAVMKGEIQDKLPEWNVVVGTREAVEIVKYLKDGEYKAAAEAAAAAKAAEAPKAE